MSTIRVPEEYMGDVNRDLNTRRGRVLGMDTADGMQVVRAHVPQAELFTYATELRSLSGGRGSFTATLDHYEEVPSHVAQKVIEAHEGAQRGASRCARSDPFASGPVTTGPIDGATRSVEHGRVIRPSPRRAEPRHDAGRVWRLGGADGAPADTDPGRDGRAGHRVARSVALIAAPAHRPWASSSLHTTIADGYATTVDEVEGFEIRVPDDWQVIDLSTSDLDAMIQRLGTSNPGLADAIKAARDSPRRSRTSRSSPRPRPGRSGP